VAVLAATSLALLHSTRVRARALTWLATYLEQRYAVSARASRLEFNLLTLRAELRDVEVADRQRMEDPFLSAQAIGIDLPWSMLWNGVSTIDYLELENLRIQLVRAGDGTWNLPAPPARERVDAPAPVYIHRLIARNATVTIDDRLNHWGLDLRGLDLDLRPSARGISGDLSVRLDGPSGSARVRHRGSTTSLTELGGTVSFDGSRVAIANGRARAPEGDVTVAASIGVLVPEPDIDASYQIHLRLESIERWIGQATAERENGVAGVRGTLQVSGRAIGPLNSLAIDLNADGRDISWSTLNGISLRVRSHITSETMVIEEAVLGVADGSATARGTIALGGTAQSGVSLTWRNLDALEIVRAAAPTSAVAPLALIDGRLDAQWQAWSPARIDATIESEFRASNGNRAGHTLRSLPIEGSLRFATRSGRWQLQLDHRIARSMSIDGRIDGNFPSDDYTASSIEGTVQVRADDLGSAIAQAGFRELAGLEQIDGALRGSIDVSGTVRSPRAHAVLEARAAENTIAADASLAFGSGDPTLAGTFQAQIHDPSALLPSTVTSLEPRGSFSVEGKMAGTLTRPSVVATIHGSNLELAGQRADNVNGHLRLVGTEVFFDELTLAQGAGRLVLDGSYHVGRRHFSVDAHARGVHLDPLIGVGPRDATSGTAAMDIGARFDLDAKVSGTATAPAGLVEIQASDVRWDERLLGDISSRIELMDGTARVEALAPILNSRLTGTVGLRAPYPAAVNAHADRAEVATLAKLAALDEPVTLSGTTTFTIDARGELDQVRNSTAILTLQQLDAAIEGRTVRLTSPARLTYSDDLISAANLEVVLGASVLRAAGSIGSTASGNPLALTLTGDLSDLVATRPFITSDDVTMSGAVRAAVTVAGTIARPIVTGELALEGGRIGWKENPPATDLRVDASYRNGSLILQSVSGEWQQARLSASGILPARLFEEYLPRTYLESLTNDEGVGTVSGRVQSITAAIAAPFVEPDLLAKLEADATVSFELTAASLRPEDVQGSLQFDELQLAIAGVPIAQRQPTRFVLDEGLLRIARWNWGAEGNELAVTGTIASSGDLPIDATVLGNLDLRVVGIVLPQTMRTSGRAALGMRIHGPRESLLVDGELRVADGEVALDDPRLAVTGIGGRLALSRDRVVIEELTGTANGGDLEMHGSISYPNFRVTEGRIDIAGKGIALEWPEGLRTAVDGTVTLAIADEDLRLTGDVAILRGSYREPMSLSGLVAALRSQSDSAIRPDRLTRIDRTALEIALRTTDDIRIDNNYGRIGVAGDLVLIGTVAQPALAGRAIIQEGGEIYLGGKRYVLEAGSIDFVSPARIEPDVNISARTRAGGTDVSLMVSGTPDTLSVDLTSDDPNLSQAELTSLLLTGQTSFAGETAAVASGQLLMLLSGEVFGVAGRAIGLDTLRLDRGFDNPGFRFDPGLVATETDPSARLTFSKRLSRQLELTLSQSLRESGDLTWIGSYHPRNNLELRVVSNDNGNRSYEFRHDVELGPPVVKLDGAPDRRLDSPPSSSRIREVRFAGAPGFALTELAALLSLSAGEEFDSYQWQQDRERLLALYHGRGYREATVIGRRFGDEGPARRDSTSGTDWVTLEYDIERGPRTLLEFTGYTPSPDVRKALEDAWSRSVFDGFLTDELQAIVRAHLVSNDYLQPSVEVAVRRSDDGAEKRAVLTVAPGTRTRSREIVFVGNNALGAEQLTARIDQEGLHDRMWLDPSSVARALEEYYHREGWLSATAGHKGPAYDADGAARLVLTINEGAAFRVGAIAFDGVELAPEREIRRRLTLEAGSPYSTARLEAARQAVEAAYQEHGFNSARVTLATDVRTESAAVDVTFAVQEGAKQVLRDVVITGALRTDRAFVMRALQLEVGTPVNLVEWYRARKRLYDTGVFRRADVRPERLEDPESRPPEEEAIRARVELEEWPLLRLQYGLQVLDEQKPARDTRQFGPGLASDLTHRNLFGRAATAGLSLRYTREAQIARAFVRAPSFFGLPISSNLFASKARERRVFERARPLLIDVTDFTAEQRLRPWSVVELAYGASFQRNHTFRQPDPSDPIPFDITVQIARLTFTGLIDTRDDLVSPSRGLFHSSNFEYGSEIDSGLRFVRYFGQGAYYRSLGDGVVFASGARLGLGGAFGDELLPSERFFAGGARSVRGYAEDAVGPRDILGLPAGGEALLIFNEELRFPIYRWVGGVGFFDAGNTFLPRSQLSIRDLRSSLGFGARVSSPFGLIRIDAGFPLRRLPDEPRLRWSFSVGQTF